MDSRLQPRPADELRTFPSVTSTLSTRLPLRPEPSKAPGVSADLLRGSAWARHLDSATLSYVCSVMREHTVKAGYYVFRRGDPVENWVGVTEGLVQLSVGSASGRVSAMLNINKGDWFDESPLLTGRERPYDVVALRNTRMLLLPDHVFQRLLTTHPAFNQYIMALVANRSTGFVELLEGDRLYNSDRRVARCLAAMFDDSDPERTVHSLPLTQGELGLLSGVSRQRTNVALHNLVAQGIVKLEKQCMSVLDLEALRAFGGMTRRRRPAPLAPQADLTALRA